MAISIHKMVENSECMYKQKSKKNCFKSKGFMNMYYNEFDHVNNAFKNMYQLLVSKKPSLI